MEQLGRGGRSGGGGLEVASWDREDNKGTVTGWRRRQKISGRVRGGMGRDALQPSMLVMDSFVHPRLIVILDA